MDSKAVSDAKSAMKANVKELLAIDNVSAVGVGPKIVAGERTDVVAVIVSVKKKKPLSQLKKFEIIPQKIGGIISDVVETGEFFALRERTDKWRPCPGGVSLGHFAITAGTLGAFVKKDDKVYILSNNHVMANSNESNIGDDIYQPGKVDGGREEDTIAKLHDYVPIKFSGEMPTCPISLTLTKMLNTGAKFVGSSHRFNTSKQDDEASNTIDAAIAEPLSMDDLELMILEIGSVEGVVEAEFDMGLQKSGRTTGYTQDAVQQMHVTAQVNYGGPIAVFEDQILAGAMSQGGDSGSLVLNKDNFAVGLLFAGSSNSTLMNPIQYVLDAFQAEFVTKADKYKVIVEKAEKKEGKKRKLVIWYPLGEDSLNLAIRR